MYHGSLANHQRPARGSRPSRNRELDQLDEPRTTEEHSNQNTSGTLAWLFNATLHSAFLIFAIDQLTAPLIHIPERILLTGLAAYLLTGLITILVIVGSLPRFPHRLEQINRRVDAFTRVSFFTLAPAVATALHIAFQH